MSAVLDFLGRLHAEEGDKETAFANKFDAFGVKPSLGSMPTGSFIIANEKARTDMLVRVLDTIKVNGRVDSAKASELQGLLNFE